MTPAALLLWLLLPSRPPTHEAICAPMLDARSGRVEMVCVVRRIRN